MIGEEKLSDKQIHDRDLDWLKSSDGVFYKSGVAREVNSTRDQLLHDQLSADQLFTRSTSLSQLL